MGAQFVHDRGHRLGGLRCNTSDELTRRGVAESTTSVPGAIVDRYSRDAPRLVDGVGELPDLDQRGSRLGKPRPELMPGVRDQWEDLEPDRYSGRSRTLGHPHRIVAQHLGVPGLEQQRRQAGEVAEHRRDQGVCRIDIRSVPTLQECQPAPPSAVSRRALMLIDGLDQEKSKPPLIMIAPAGIGREASRPAAT